MSGEKPRPWTRTRSHRQADYTILRIREDFFVNPRDGREHPRVVMEMRDWVNVIALTVKREVVLIRQFRPGVEGMTLEIPGGVIDEGEPPATAAARELEEETGFKPASVKPLGFTHPNPAFQGNRAFTFLAEGCVKIHDGRLDEGEDIEVELHPFDDIPMLIREGHLTHAIVVAAFGLLQAHGWVPTT